MFSINGKRTLGRNATITGGRIIHERGNLIDELKSKKADNIEKISIDSDVIDVKISLSNSSIVEAHLYGQANINGCINFDVYIVKNELRVILNIEGTCYGTLKLDITVPPKIFKKIKLNSISADITLNEGVSTEYIEMETQSGDIQTNATFAKAYVSTISGDVKAYINAKEKISAEISTISGDVLTKLKNVGKIKLSTRSLSGDIKRNHKKGIGHSASINISTTSGDITVR